MAATPQLNTMSLRPDWSPRRARGACQQCPTGITDESLPRASGRTLHVDKSAAAAGSLNAEREWSRRCDRPGAGAGSLRGHRHQLALCYEHSMRFDAYLFDVQGTLLDFYTPVSDAVTDYLRDVGHPDLDPGDFTRAWRKDYFTRVSSLDQLSGAWQKVQRQYEAGFAAVAESYGLPTPDAATAHWVSASWQRLVPWPDVRDGLAAIRRDAITATLSNTDMATVIGLARNLDLRFDAYFTAEIFRRFKPDPQVYLGALDYLGIAPDRAALVASHPYDLDAAAALGLGTVFVSRPEEYGDAALAHSADAGQYTQFVTGIDQVD